MSACRCNRPEANVCTSIVVAAELRSGGVAKKASARLTAQLEAILSALSVLPLEAPADDVYGRVRTQLERAAQPTDSSNLLIAAQAIALGHVLVTDNESDFGRVEALTCQNWLRHT